MGRSTGNIIGVLGLLLGLGVMFLLFTVDGVPTGPNILLYSFGGLAVISVGQIIRQALIR